ncbi:hypothetical protein G9274_000659 [Stenotrophomonas rhizophila]|nr:hypothetical protein G9274_000659 [Stenotrophomonas rhizophila]
MLVQTLDLNSRAPIAPLPMVGGRDRFMPTAPAAI